MSILFGRVNLCVSYILEPVDEHSAKMVGFRFNANGKVLDSPTLASPTVRNFVHSSATSIATSYADQWRGQLVWVLLQINVSFEGIPLRDHIRMSYEVWAPRDESPIPDWKRYILPPGPGCQVQ